jgi:hypothetical protein
MKNTVSWDVMSRDCRKSQVSGASIATIIKVKRFGELGTLAVTSNRSTLRKNTARSTRHNNPEDGIIHSDRRRNLTLHYIIRLGSVAEM